MGEDLTLQNERRLEQDRQADAEREHDAAQKTFIASKMCEERDLGKYEQANFVCGTAKQKREDVSQQKIVFVAQGKTEATNAQNQIASYV